MLALKTLSAVASAPASGIPSPKTLIFDEVDAGIGGRVATVVGQKLASLGDRFQVLCITHLPQIAACGRTQFLIEKRVQNRRTVTSVKRLNGGERVAEIARMMGGGAAGEKALESARELLDTSGVRGGAKAKGERRKSTSQAGNRASGLRPLE
jgi:DNA repair protein RecN (Recombination protein N)